MSAPIAAAAPAPVKLGGPNPSWAHRALYERVIDALHALPSRFRTKLRIAGVAASDLFTLNTPLGAAIEQSVVENLNELRPVWDPADEYQRYSFVRQPQGFPDVRLQTTAPGATEPIIMGIELKGWFVLAKEGEPSFRYAVTPAVCQPQDLLVVYPWHLDEVISGVPQLMRPLVTEARYAAEHRNHYWTTLRTVRSGRPRGGIFYASHTAPYPQKSDRINDEAEFDSGGNFGRVARGGFTDEFVADVSCASLSGIPAEHWRSFLAAFADGATGEAIRHAITAIRSSLGDEPDPDDPMLRAVTALADLIRERG